jgi:hypothetical protein
MERAPVLRPSEAVNLAGQDTGRDHLSHSSISMQNACLRKFELHYEERLRLITTPRPLALGRAFHKAIELGDPQAGAQALRESRSEFLDPADEDRQVINESIVLAAAGAYLGRWGAPDDEAREFEYKVRLRSPWTGRPSQTFDLLGYADGVLDNGDWLELVESKFVGRIDPLDVRHLPLDRQVGLACYGLWRATGKAVQRVSYRFTRKPSIKQKQGETVDQFCERLVDDYEARPDFYLDEQRLFRSNEDLLRIEAELWTWAEERRQAKRWGFFPRNVSHCKDFGGCQYLSVCAGDPDAMNLYERKPLEEEQEIPA